MDFGPVPLVPSDDLGRPATTQGPSHTIVISGTATAVQNMTWFVYNQTILPSSGPWAPDSTWTETGYYDGSTNTVVYPVKITNMDKDGRTTDVINSTTGTGSAPVTPSLTQSDWSSWSSNQFSAKTDPTATPPTVAHQMVSKRVYFNIPSSGTGTAGTNYGETDLGYDALERRNRVVAPGGTIARTVWTTPQRVASVWIGTNDTGATDADPSNGGAAPNNMVMVTANQFDNGSNGGNGNITQVTKYVSATSGDTRVTGFGYDFRDRRVGITDALNAYTVIGYDNLDRQTQILRYVSFTGNLMGQNKTLWDDRDHVYQTLIYAVDPSTGTVGNNLTGNNWYDEGGNLLQSIAPGAGIVFNKTTFNGAGWPAATYIGYNTSGTSWTQANTVSGDIIIEQKQNTFNEVGSVISAATFQRLNDESPTATGALSYGTSPKARVSYAAGWFDGIDRQIATGNYGAIASFTRPTTPPTSSATVLVNLNTFDSAGRPYQMTDPKGIISQLGFDDANRKIQTIEDVGGLARTTNFSYTLDNLPAAMTAVNSTTGDQTTTYLYGTTLSESGVARNDLLRYTIYPDTPLGWSTLSVDQWANLSVDDWASLGVDPADSTQNTYNRLGEKQTFRDQRGTVHTYVRDKLGRQTDDCVTTVGTDTDNAVLRISFGYEVRGMVNLITSADNATPGSGTILNQVALTFNSFSQPIKEQQDHGGAVSGSSPSVQYDYDTGASGSNEIRFTDLTYPNGRVITNSFGTSGGMNDLLNRVETIHDTTNSTDLATYTRLGLNTVVRIAYPEPAVWLDLWGGTSGVFNGLDLFNRIIDQRWQNNTGGTPVDIDRYQYGYDQNSNRQWKANIVSAAASVPLDEFYTLDNVNRLTAMQGGTLNSGKTGITGTPTIEQDWTLDPTGNWSNFLTKASGTTDLDQTRTSSPVNEITDITESTGPTWIVPAYDAAGNTTTMPQTADPTQEYIAVYDAWNRMVTIGDGTNTVADYKYDGHDMRIVRLGYASGVPSETRDFYFTASGRDIEQRVNGSTSMDQQHVWGIRYANELVCRDDATPGRLYVCQDATFSATSVVDATGVAAERFVYSPYGTCIVLNALWSATSDLYNFIYRFQGGRFDRATGLLLYWRREYAAVLGKWLTRDSDYFDGASLYQFVSSSPVRYTDPFGLQATQPADPASATAVSGIHDPQDVPPGAVKKGDPPKLFEYRLNPKKIVGTVKVTAEFVSDPKNNCKRKLKLHVELQSWSPVGRHFPSTALIMDGINTFHFSYLTSNNGGKDKTVTAADAKPSVTSSQKGERPDWKDLEFDYYLDVDGPTTFDGVIQAEGGGKDEMSYPGQAIRVTGGVTFDGTNCDPKNPKVSISVRQFEWGYYHKDFETKPPLAHVYPTDKPGRDQIYSGPNGKPLKDILGEESDNIQSLKGP